MGKDFRNFALIGGALALTAMSAAPSHAQDAEPLILEPATPWLLTYTQDSCELRREFGPEDQRVRMELRQFSPGDGFELTISSSILGEPDGDPSVRYHPDEVGAQWLSTTFASFDDGLWSMISEDSLRPAAAKIAAREPEPLDLEQSLGQREWNSEARDTREAQVNAITFSGGFERAFTLRTGEMHGPMEAMRTCLDELLIHWGIDARAHRDLTRPAKPKNSEFGAPVQYPSSMIRKGISARLHLRLIISASGEVTECSMPTPSGFEAFRRSACRDYSRVSFEPALDANGQPMESYWVTTLTYEITS